MVVAGFTDLLDEIERFEHRHDLDVDQELKLLQIKAIAALTRAIRNSSN